MTAVENINPEKEPVPASWVPRVITGGNGKGPPEGPTPPVTNWLIHLPVDTVFVAQPRGSAEMNLYNVQYASEECYLLVWRLPDGKLLDMYYNPEDFCKMMKSYKVLGSLPISEEKNDSDRTDRSADVVLHEAVPGGDQLPQDEA
jgi:hypothetical protein